MAKPCTRWTGGWWGHQGWAPYHQSQRGWFRPGREEVGFCWPVFKAENVGIFADFFLVGSLILEKCYKSVFLLERKNDKCLWTVLINGNVYYIVMCYYFSILYICILLWRNVVPCDPVCVFGYVIGDLERCWFLGISPFVYAWLFGPFIASNRPLVIEFITTLASTAGREGVHPAGHESRLRLLRFCLLLLHCSAQLRLEEVAWHSSGVCPMQHHFVLITASHRKVVWLGRNSYLQQHHV